MTQQAFGVGALWGASTMDAYGTAIAVPTPLKFGELQDIQLDISRDIKELYGQLMMPVALGGGKMKFQFKAKFARIFGRIFNDLFFGQTLTAGTLNGIVDGTTGVAIPATPFQITPTVPASGTWSKDLGVLDSSGLPMTRVASAPATGQYMVAAGVYTFNTADTAKIVYISYGYTATQAAAKVITLNNVVMGATPQFGVDLSINFSGKQENWRFPNCVASKLGFNPKQDDFQTNDLDFSAFADPVSGVIGYIYTSE